MTWLPAVAHMPRKNSDNLTRITHHRYPWYGVYSPVVTYGVVVCRAHRLMASPTYQHSRSMTMAG